MKWFCPKCETVPDGGEACPSCDYCKKCCTCQECKGCKDMLPAEMTKCTNCKQCVNCCPCKQCLQCSSYTTKDVWCGVCHGCQKCCKCVAGWVKRLNVPKDKKYDLTSELTSFYVVEELLAFVPVYERDYPSKFFRLKVGELGEFENELVRLRDRFAKELARAYFDYIAHICCGEMRHSKRCSFPNLTGSLSRECIYEKAPQFNPFEYLPRLEEVFRNGSWSGGYGGKAWAGIAKAGMMYQQESDVVFVDHCVDLTHNNGTMLNKPLYIFLVEHKLYRNMLNRKATGNLLQPALPHLMVVEAITEVLAKAGRLGVLPQGFEWEVVKHVPYGPIAWGDKQFPALTMVSQQAETYPLNWNVVLALMAEKAKVKKPVAKKEVYEEEKESDDE